MELKTLKKMLVYSDMNVMYLRRDGVLTERKVTPLEIKILGDSPFVVVYCHNRKSYRSFLVKNIRLISKVNPGLVEKARRFLCIVLEKKIF